MIRRSIPSLGLTSLILAAKPDGGETLWYDKPARLTANHQPLFGRVNPHPIIP